jgi:hypothetical protein
MAVKIINGYISEEKAAEFYSYLDGYSLVSRNPNILNALGYPTSAIASQTNEETGVLHGVDHPTNKELGKLFVDIRQTAENFFGTEIDLCQANYQVLLPGAENPIHADAMHLDGSPIQADGPEEEIKWSGLLYLNTHGIDFLGGNLSFPGFNIEYCPVAGDLVLFQGDVEHRHAVSKILSGHRKNIVFFWSDKGNVSEENFFSVGYSK